MVATTENTNAHKSVEPVRTPTMVHIVTVPGPINAAVTMVLGPKYRLQFIFNPRKLL
jgi:hypothetical protein